MRYKVKKEDNKKENLSHTGQIIKSPFCITKHQTDTVGYVDIVSLTGDDKLFHIDTTDNLLSLPLGVSQYWDSVTTMISVNTTSDCVFN